MQNQKLENLLNLSLSATTEEREKSESLNVGYNSELNTWELIVRYSGSLAELTEHGIIVDEMINEYARAGDRLCQQSAADRFHRKTEEAVLCH